MRPVVRQAAKPIYPHQIVMRESTAFIAGHQARKRASQMPLVVKKLPSNAGDVRDTGSIPGLRRSPGKGHGDPLQYSCLENPMDRRAWWATVQRVAESDRTEVT